jgi:phage repressor protein C with HTH and peptisase S24 domain
MIFLRRVTGESMLPTLRPGQIVICNEIRKFSVGQIVVAFVKGREVIKRIVEIDGATIYLGVDDSAHAHNGKYYARIIDRDIMGVVFWPRNL